MKKLLILAAAGGACLLALPAGAQSIHDYDTAPDYRPDYRYDTPSRSISDQQSAYDQGYRDAMRDGYYGDALPPEDVEVAYGPPINPYGDTTAERHPLAGKYNFSSDGTSKVGGWTEVGPHTTRGQALGAAAGGSTGGVYSTGP